MKVIFFQYVQLVKTRGVRCKPTYKTCQKQGGQMVKCQFLMSARIMRMVNTRLNRLGKASRRLGLKSRSSLLVAFPPHGFILQET